MIDVDETKGSYWTGPGAFIHRARLFCPSCASKGSISGIACFACLGSGYVIVGCGGTAEIDPYWSERGMGANCLRCDSVVPMREVVTLEEAEHLKEVEPERWVWVQVSEREL